MMSVKTLESVLRAGLRDMSPSERNAWKDLAASVLAALGAVHGEKNDQARMNKEDQS